MVEPQHGHMSRVKFNIHGYKKPQQGDDEELIHLFLLENLIQSKCYMN